MARVDSGNPKGAWVGYGPRFLSGPQFGSPVVCLISRSGSFGWNTEQITLSQQYFNTLAPGLIQVVRKKTAGSHVALRGNISAHVWLTDLVKVSKDAASLVVCTQKIFCLGVRFFVSDVISGGLFGHLGQLYLSLKILHNRLIRCICKISRAAHVPMRDLYHSCKVFRLNKYMNMN